MPRVRARSLSVRFLQCHRGASVSRPLAQRNANANIGSGRIWASSQPTLHGLNEFREEFLRHKSPLSLRRDTYEPLERLWKSSYFMSFFGGFESVVGIDRSSDRQWQTRRISLPRACGQLRQIACIFPDQQATRKSSRPGPGQIGPGSMEIQSPDRTQTAPGTRFRNRRQLQEFHPSRWPLRGRGKPSLPG